MGLKELLIKKQESSKREYLSNAICFFNRYYIFDLLVIFVCVASFCCSWIESIANYDSLHWGFIYSQALDLKRGAMPHSESLIFHGYLTTWIQSIFLTIFGERLIVVGVTTGLFYSLTLFLSYRVFVRFLQKHYAFIALLLIFLIHPYIIYPAANYYAYTFQLLALIFFLRYSEGSYYGFLAGFLLCVSVLSRYSSVIAILPPFIILLCWEFFAVQGSRKNIIKKIVLVSFGFFVPLILFFTYLFVNSALDDFFFQNRMIIELWGKINNVITYLNFLAFIFQIDTNSYASDFRGKLFTLILIICLLILAREIIRKILGKTLNPTYARYDILAVCLVAVFGYLNSIHIYETCRLINGSSIGVGVCVLVFYNNFINAKKPLKYLMIFLSVSLILFLSSTLFFKKTTSSYYPWRIDVLSHSGVTNENIGILRGKILSKEYNDFYQEVFDIIAPFKNSCYIINYTSDAVAFLINDLPRVQLSSIFYPCFEYVYKQADLIDQKRAVILARQEFNFPGYKEIFRKKWPDEIPWLGGDYLYIYAPKRFIGNNKVPPSRANQN